ncbi:hypothetical protein KC19_VG287800 [Ceratodon purpureus]|uniref:protein phosphatase methylesterase-1 n=1 Tax=Ceratodon purpureus TaxID=3225 RepID=A0A8T0HUP7_CERPU|nr:hypothetical protein KC19_VG287800 [Ceratodon purpureus]
MEESGVNGGAEGSNGGVGSLLSRPSSLRKQLSLLSHRVEDGSSSPSVLTPVVEAPFDEVIASLPLLVPSLHPLPEDEVITDVLEEEEEDDLGVEEVASSVYDNVPPRPSRVSSSSRYSPLSWQGHFDEDKMIAIPDSEDNFHVFLAGTEGPVVFCLHGGGYTGLSFALIAGKMKEKVRVVAMDMRGHGLSKTTDDTDLSAETQCQDVLNVISEMYRGELPAIILIGHSMGGAIAVRVASQRALPNLAGLVVIDVVEGTAMASLVHMQRILANRQLHFPSVERAIEWSVRGGGFLQNVESARISVPSTLKFDTDKKCYVWLTALEESEAHWRGWYEGLSELFISCPAPKLLLLAGTDRLDRSLTIGQMQGKFQMIVVRHTGHAIQEDEPDEFAGLVLNFITRNRIGTYGVEIPGLRRPISLRFSN